ncbi:unnamed protein product [Soboliphyme baturini]|uniref:Transposase n=1 Tax=Soboliphyme baturini TaxID=241478 RepID=A0A183J1F2_9BILA|nr:unnamed protein product [Soboliphyme baturini]
MRRHIARVLIVFNKFTAVLTLDDDGQRRTVLPRSLIAQRPAGRAIRSVRWAAGHLVGWVAFEAFGCNNVVN